MKRLAVPALAALVLLAGCSKRTANDYYSQAEREYKRAQQVADTSHNREDLSNLFKPALEGYQKVVQEYPNDPLAEQALFMVATIQSNQMHDLEQAVVSYKLFANTHPDAKRAPEATFLVGYLYNNSLNQFDSASVWLKRFLDRYPNHELAASAQFELNQLGKSPDQLIPSDSIEVRKKEMVAGSKQKKVGGRQHPM
jgi:outer membrane protein assembly factor BamD (BamD/ComL family)